MRIVFFGTSHGVPEAHRHCSSTMIEIGDKRYFIDMGMDSISELINRHIPIDSVKAVFVTHMHGDHTNGLIPFVDLISWYFKTADPLILFPEKGAIEALKGWVSFCESSFREDIRLSSYDEAGCIYDDGTLKVTAFRTQHTAVSYALLVEAEGRRVLFTGDLKNPGIDFPVEALSLKTDLVICESAHFTSLDYIPVLKDKPVEHVIVNHYSPRFSRDLPVFAEQMQPVPTELATDGFELSL